MVFSVLTVNRVPGFFYRGHTKTPVTSPFSQIYCRLSITYTKITYIMPLRKPVPVYMAIMAFIIGLLIAVLGYIYWPSPPHRSNRVIPTRLIDSSYQFIRPLLYLDRKYESASFAPLKTNILKVIDSLKTAGAVSDVAIYLKEFNHGEWMGINEEALYHPGSLFKVPLLIAALRMGEADPAFLSRKVVFNPPKDLVLPIQNYVSGTIERGESYTVRELLRYTISYSDNNALWMLNQLLDTQVVNKVYTDLGMGLPVHGEDDGRVRTSARSYSILLNTLYNATYTRPEDSEFAMELMADCKFKDGMVRGLPDHFKLVHKFGEWDNQVSFELHESGILYINDEPYLLTVLTRGNGRKNLPLAIASLTKSIVESLSLRFAEHP